MRIQFQNINQSKFVELLFAYTGIGIAITLTWWPLLNSIFCLVFFGIWLLFSAKKLITKKKLLLILLFSSLYLLAILGLFYSENTQEAFISLQHKSPLLLFPVAFGLSSIYSKKTIEIILYAFSVAFALFCFYCIGKGLIILFSTGSYTYLTGYKILALKDMYPFITGVFCIFGISFHFSRILYNQIYFYADVFLICVFWVMLLLLSNAICLLLGLLFTLYYLLKILKRFWYKFFFLSTGILLLSFTIIFNKNLQNKLIALTNFSKQSTIQLDSDSSLGRAWDGKALRIAIWECSRQLINQNFLWGLGSGDVQDELQKTYEKRKFYFASRYNKYNAHNQYVQQFLANGFMGFMALLFCIFIPLFLKLPFKKQLLVNFLFIFGAICLTESILEVNKGIVWYSFFNSIFVFSENRTVS